MSFRNKGYDGGSCFITKENLLNICLLCFHQLVSEHNLPKSWLVR